MKFINKNLKKFNKILNLKKIMTFLKKHYILILTLLIIIYLIKTNFREYFGSMGNSDVNECKPKALPEMIFCGNEKDLPRTQARNLIKNLKMQIKYYLKVVKENMDKSDEIFKSAITVAKSKSDKLNKKWNKDTKKPGQGATEEVGVLRCTQPSRACTWTWPFMQLACARATEMAQIHYQ